MSNILWIWILRWRNIHNWSQVTIVFLWDLIAANIFPWVLNPPLKKHNRCPYPASCTVLRGASWAGCLSGCPLLSWRTRWSRLHRHWRTEALCPEGTTPAGWTPWAGGCVSSPGTSCSDCSRCLCTGLGETHAFMSTECAAVYICRICSKGWSGKYLCWLV